MLMLPISSILEVFPSVTRELARQQEKEVQIVIRGAEIEVDRRILQEIKDPLMHLIRNCIDHGIERPEVRERRNKPRRGAITVTNAQRDSSKFEIVVADDGGGIDLAKVSSAANRLGLISPESAERLSEQEAKSLVFQSGLSTSPLITDISGRGLGLAIVQEKVEKLGGTITVETKPALGTEFRLLLPLTLATLRGLLVRSEGQALILPIIHVERVARLYRNEIQTVQNRETIRLAGQAYSLVRLGQALELPVKSATHEPSDRLLVVILSTGERRIAFAVDEIIGEQEVLMKGLGAQLARVRNIAGATVLGNGQVMPIINVPDLIKSAIKTMDTAPNMAETTAAKDKSILIVEDSITARMQLKNILELSGYMVKTAVDGLEALMTLRTEDFDLVVSDVDMPRLNGLDLTTRIRNDKKLADMPVVLVTTLASRQDQERGIEVGANAYITKSNFDQNKLLDAIRRLI
jgi:two-component system chemotaxis sensor kinase CheA